MKVYILKNREQFIEEMNEDEMLAFCAENQAEAFVIHCSFAWNDWNWIRQYPDTLYIVAASLEEARNFVLKAYYHADEFDGERGVIFRHITSLCAQASA